MAVNWIDTSGSGNWSDGFNWSTGNPPTANHNVVINTGATTETVTYDAATSSIALTTLSTGANDTLVLNASGRTLTVSGAATFGGALMIGNGGLSLTTDSSVAGLYSQSGGTLSTAAALGLNGGASLSGGTTTLNGACTINGAYRQTGGTFIGRAGVTLNGDANLSGGILRFNAPSSISGLYTESGGTLSGNATVSLNDGASISGGAATMEGSGRTLLVAGTTSNFFQGSLDLTDGRTLENRGTIHVGTGGDFEIDSSTGDGVFLNEGKLIIDTGILTVNSAMRGAGTVTIGAGATFTDNGGGFIGVNIQGNAGSFSLTSSAYGGDYSMAIADLHSTDTITGSDTDQDKLTFVTSGTISAGLFAHVSGIDTIQLGTDSSHRNQISLTDQLVASAHDHTLTIYSGVAADIDASAVVTASSQVDFVQQGTALNSFIGGAGNDTFTFGIYSVKNEYSTYYVNTFSGDTVTGGSGTDTLTLYLAKSVSASAFAHTSGIEIIRLGTQGHHSVGVILPDAMVGSANGHKVTITLGDIGGYSVDASAVTTSSNRIEVIADKVDPKAGGDGFTGGSGNDVFRFTAAALEGTNVGINGGPGHDDFVLTTANATKLPYMTGIETIDLADGNNSIALTDAMVSSAEGTTVRVNGGSGNDIVDGQAVTTSTNHLMFVPKGGIDTLTGGAGDDTFLFTSTYFNGNDTVNGGGGNDTLSLTVARTLAASDFAHVSGVETLSLAAGTNKIALTDSMVGSAAGATFTILGNTGNDTIDASAVTTAADRVVFESGSGRDTLTGGASKDSFQFSAADLDSTDTVAGGGNTDALVFTTNGTIAAAAFTHVSSIETINLANGVNQITLSDALVASADSKTLRVNGGNGADTIDAGAVAAGRHVSISGGGGADAITASASADQFFYGAASDSTSTGYDTITAMDLSMDRFHVGVSGTSTASGALHSGANFDSEFASDIGTVAGHSGVLLTVTASGGTGDLAGSTFVFVDLDGSGHYEAGHDLAIRLVSFTGTFGASDFI